MRWRHNPAVLLRSPLGLLAIFALAAALALGAWWNISSQDSGPPAASVVLAPTVAVSEPIATPVPTVAPVSESRLEAAAQLRRDGDAAGAAEAYLSIAATNPAARPEALLGAGIARFEAGDPDGAIEALKGSLEQSSPNSPTRRRAAYLLGLRLNDAGRFAEALAALREFVQSATLDGLQPYIVAEFARASARSGDAVAAASAWDAVLGSPAATNTLRAAAYRDRADAAAAAGDTAAVVTWLTRLVGIQPNPENRYALATAAKRRGDGDTFAAQLRAVMSESPSSPFASRAIADLTDAGYAVDPGREGFVYYRRGAYTDARRVLAVAAVAPGLSAADRAFRSYYLAAAYEDSGSLATAVQWYDIAASADPGSAIAHRAQYWAARTVETLGDVRSASARYQSLVRSGPAGEFTAEAAFRAGYTLFAAGDASAAISTWTNLAVEPDARLLYWQARAYERIGNATAAREAYAKAASVGPFDFHGLLAVTALGQAASPDVTYRPRTYPRTVDWDSIATWLTPYAGPRPAAASPPSAASDFMAVGLYERAEAAIIDEAAGAGPWRLLAIIHEAYDAELLSTAARLTVALRESTGVSPALVPKAVTQLAYPVDYVVSLDAYAKANNVDPLFFAALIRQESFWDPSAVSSAGAIGLTQVIPDTGDGIARALGIKGFRPSDLLRPSVSLQFGAYYIGGQLKHYADPLAALAAYNAGPANAIRWTDRVSPSKPADFLEAIDIPETQHYVQSVMEYYALYRRAYE